LSAEQESAGGTPASEEREAAPAEPSAAGGAEAVCDLCGTIMYEWHCRLICPACGYQRDCSDP
jgi:hypothetical protein